MTISTVNGVRTRLDQLDAILQGSHFGYEEMTTVLNAVPDLVRTVRAILDLAEKLDGKSGTYYYGNRHTHSNGIGYVTGISEALEQSAARIRSTILASYR